MTDNKQNKVNTKILVVFAFIVIFLIVYVSFKDYNDLKNNGRYTIGITERKKITPKSGTNVIYKYYVNETEYESFNDYYPDIVVPGGRYYVKFSNKNPENSHLLRNFPVPDSIKKAPPEGWSNIPSATSNKFD